MLSKAAFSNSNDVFSTIKIMFRRIVNIKVFEQKAEVNTLIYVPVLQSPVRCLSLCW